MLNAEVDIMGVGGVTHGRDVFEYREVGASAVQVATAYIQGKENVFSTLLADLVEVMG